MRSLFLFFIISIFFYSCKDVKPLSPKDLRTGTFETILKNNKEVKSFAVRNDSIQVETYNNKKDTFYIYWKSDFEYVLKHKNPKTSLDSIDFIIKITGIHKKSYTFNAHFKGNNFIQKGTATKITDNE